MGRKGNTCECCVQWEVKQEKECLCCKEVKEALNKITFQVNNTSVFSTGHDWTKNLCTVSTFPLSHTKP